MSNYLHAIADAFNALGARVVFRDEQDARDFAENVSSVREAADSDSPGAPTPSAAESDEVNSATGGVAAAAAPPVAASGDVNV